MLFVYFFRSFACPSVKAVPKLATALGKLFLWAESTSKYPSISMASPFFFIFSPLLYKPNSSFPFLKILESGEFKYFGELSLFIIILPPNPTGFIVSLYIGNIILFLK